MFVDFFDIDSITGIIKLKKDAKVEENTKFILDLGISCEAETPKNDNSKKENEKENSDDIMYNPKFMQLILEIDSSKTPSLLPSDVLFIGYPREYNFILHNPPQFLATISVSIIIQTVKIWHVNNLKLSL